MPKIRKPPKPPKMRVYSPLTEDRKDLFLRKLRKYGRYHQAAEEAGVSYYAVQKLRKEDADFDELCEISFQLFVDSTLVDAAQTRAVNGVTKAVYGGRFKDEVVGYEQVYSDMLLSKLLAAARPEFRNGGAQNNSGGSGGGVLVIPTHSRTIEEWEARYAAMTVLVDGANE